MATVCAEVGLIITPRLKSNKCTKRMTEWFTRYGTQKRPHVRWTNPLFRA